jgi:hypothetical protein
MTTLLFIFGYAILVAIIITIEFIHWVYTGVGTLAWAEHLLSILASKLFLQIAIPCVFIDMLLSLMDEILDKIKRLVIYFKSKQ